MRLTRYTNYGLRVLMHLAERPDRLSSIAEIAAAHRISENHLMKVVLTGALAEPQRAFFAVLDRYSPG